MNMIRLNDIFVHFYTIIDCLNLFYFGFDDLSKICKYYLLATNGRPYGCILNNMRQDAF